MYQINRFSLSLVWLSLGGNIFLGQEPERGHIMDMSKMTAAGFFDCKMNMINVLALKMEECRRNFEDCFAALDTECVFKMDGLIHRTLVSMPRIPFPGRDALELKLNDILDEDEFNHKEVRRMLTEIQSKLEFAYEVTQSCFYSRFDF